MRAFPELLSHYIDTTGIVIHNLCCELRTKQPMNIQTNTLARSCNVCTSPTILTACYHFSRRERFYGYLMSPVTIQLYLRFHVKYPIFLPDFNQSWNISTDFLKRSNRKFHVNPSCGSRHTDTRRQTDRRTWHARKISLASQLRNENPKRIAVFYKNAWISHG